MVSRMPEEVGGYILAGGKSSRMGRDKALLELAGKPLVQHAVKKLRRVCMDVRILSNSGELGAYAPIVADLHPGCGPLSGMEAGLHHSVFEWNLFLAVDMPFLPSAFIWEWVRQRLRAEKSGGLRGAVRVQMLESDGYPQPGFCLLHKDVAPFLTNALVRGEFKVLPVLRAAGRELAVRRGALPGAGFWCLPLQEFVAGRGSGPSEDWWATSDSQQAAKHLWFANLNTPEDFAEAERHLDALDT